MRLQQKKNIICYININVLILKNSSHSNYIRYLRYVIILHLENYEFAEICGGKIVFLRLFKCEQYPAPPLSRAPHFKFSTRQV